MSDVRTPLGVVTTEGDAVEFKQNRFLSSPEIRQYIRREIAECAKHHPGVAASERLRALEDVLAFIRTGVERPRWMAQQEAR